MNTKIIWLCIVIGMVCLEARGADTSFFAGEGVDDRAVSETTEVVGCPQGCFGKISQWIDWFIGSSDTEDAHTCPETILFCQAEWIHGSWCIRAGNRIIKGPIWQDNHTGEEFMLLSIEREGTVLVIKAILKFN